MSWKILGSALSPSGTGDGGSLCKVLAFVVTQMPQLPIKRILSLMTTLLLVLASL